MEGRHVIIMKKRKKRLTQTQFIAIGFILIIMAGTLLLMLPIASRSGEGTDFLSALFTATSATCVTGLVVFDTYRHWSLFGQIVILLMIQIGGLGFMTIGVFFSIFLRKKISLNTRGILQESVNTLQIGGIVKLVKKIVKGTLLFEGLGAVLLSLRFIPLFGPAEGIYYGIFHGISAFCNAGFDLMGRYEAYTSLTPFQTDPLVNLVIISLILIGGIGFVVWDDVIQNKLNFRKYQIHTKIVLTMTAILTFGGAVLFYFFERGNLMRDCGPVEAVLESLFCAVTPRTAGFNTIDTAGLSEGSFLLTIFFMFIGGSPGSTAGGIKTTTIAILIVYVWSEISQTNGCNLFGRRMDDHTIKKACIVFLINMMLAIGATLILCSAQPIALKDALFETFSAIGTVGMSSGVTRDLNTVSRIVIILLMYLGRIGSLAFALSFTHNRVKAPVQLPIGKVTVG